MTNKQTDVGTLLAQTELSLVAEADPIRYIELRVGWGGVGGSPQRLPHPPAETESRHPPPAAYNEQKTNKVI